MSEPQRGRTGQRTQTQTLDIFHFMEWGSQGTEVGAKGAPELGSGLRTHGSEGRAEPRQAWPGLGGWGGGQRRQGRHGERELLGLEEGDALLVVGGLVDEHGVHGGLPLIELVLATEHLEDGRARPQRLEVSVLGGEPKALGAEADLCPSPRGGPQQGCPSLMASPNHSSASSIGVTGCLPRRHLAL